MRAEQKAEKDWRCKTIGRIKHFTRIKKSKEFDRVYKHADKVWHTPYFVLFYKRSNGYGVGFVASKKIGNAVKRNRAKRLLKAHFIEEIERLQTGDFIFVAKPSLSEAAYSTVHEAFLIALKRSGAYRKKIT